MNLDCRPLLLTLALALASACRTPGQESLPSWNDGQAKRSILQFVARVTKPGSPDFVAVPERIAVFDNDGTLWSEQPMPVQLYFAIDRVKAL
ncbi:MAG: haloacid dehalogenase-like hydrolase, partial [Planctomycetota bacterium]